MTWQPRAVAAGVGWHPSRRPAGWEVLLGLALAAVLAWIVMLAGAMPPGGGGGQPAGMADMHGMAGMTGMTMVGSGRGQVSMLLDRGGIAIWALMVVAMMLPAALPAVAYVGANSLRWRRRRAMAAFVTVYVAIWVAFGAVLLAASALWSSIDGAVVLAIALALAAGWQLTVHKRRALQDCHRPSPLPPRGRRATVGVIRFGVHNGLACVRSCWAMMLAMGVATSATTFWMVAVAGIVTIEKLSRRPRKATRVAAAVLAAGAFIVAVGPLIA